MSGGQDQRKRYYCFTSFLTELKPDKCSYIIYGRETCPDTGRKHLQGYVEFKDKVSFKVAQKYIGDPVAHIEQRKGTNVQARDYCMKEGDYTEAGTMSKGQGARTDLTAIKEAVLSGEKLIDIVEQKVENFQQLKYAENLVKYKRHQLREAPEVYWFVGDTGTGKSRTVWDLEGLDIFNIEPHMEWFDGYWGQDVALFDDFRGNIQFATFLKLIDRYPMNVKVKGGFTTWTPKRIYITSSRTPEQCYPGCGENIEQLTRRIKEVRYF